MRNTALFAFIVRAASASVLALATYGCAHAQEPQKFDPFARDDRARYVFDLDRNFYTTAAAAREEVSLRASLNALTLRALRFQPAVSRRGASLSGGRTDDLVGILAAQDTVMVRLTKYVSYLSLRSMLNTGDEAALQKMGGVQQLSREAFNAVSDAVGRADSSSLQSARSAGYGFSLVPPPGGPRNVSADAAASAALLARNATTSGAALFRTTLASIDFGKVPTNHGALDFRTQGNAIRSDPDREVRKKGFEWNNRYLATVQDTMAWIMAHTAAVLNQSAVMSGYSDYPEQSYAARYLTRANVGAMLNAIRDSAEVNKSYERLRVGHIRKSFGYPEVHVWDLTAPEPGTRAPQLTALEARTAILAATSPLGPGYQREMARLLDPANGRLDMIPRAGRIDRPGFSTGSVGFPSTFFQGRYEGYAADVVIFAHEAGHAVQNMLMDAAHVKSRYANGPSYFTESFALLNELLVLDHLARTSATPADRTFYRQMLLEQAADLYRNAWESRFEEQVFDSAAAGHEVSASTMETMTQQTAAGYSIWFGPASERKLQWMQPLQFFTWPLYRVNYVYAKLLALTYFDMYTSDPRGFVAKYNRLLSEGYDADPQTLLRRTLGIDFNADDLVARASSVIRKWTSELEKAYTL
jgi:oligoendopeptidase F